ncbi:MAG TPA: hypothetical protein VHE78_09430 [Gemmatimonadaceae bacterium]|nr:hypothetical protein [Gemmatimonadaceae bacterium]
MLLVCGSVFAQSDVKTERLEVGSAQIQPRHGSEERKSFTISPPGAPAPTILDESLVWTTEGGRAVLVKATRETTGADVGGDTLVMSATTLAPLRLVTYGGGRTRTFFFSGARVTGTVVEADGRREVVDTVLSVPVFAGPSFFTVLSSLRITPTLDVTIPFFRPYDRKLIWVRYRFLGAEPFRDGAVVVPAWRVIGEIDGNLALYWIRQDSNALLRVVSFAAQGFGPISMDRRKDSSP